jgi:hypothetical protein
MTEEKEDRQQKTIKIRKGTLDRLRLLKKLSGGIAMTELLETLVSEKLKERQEYVKKV